MRLAADNMVIAHGGNVVRFRPSLRAAIRLQRAYGLGALYDAIASQHFGITLAVLREAGIADPEAIFAGRSLASAFADLQPALIDFIVMSFGLDPADDDEAPTQGEIRHAAPSIERDLETLFEVGTGWLGWSAEEALSSTPAEILAAQRGMAAKLNAIYGGGNKPKTDYDPRDIPSPEEVRSSINKLRAVAKGYAG
jgi:hypothetical protein